MGRLFPLRSIWMLLRGTGCDDVDGILFFSVFA
jgi:hypothetical protein